MSVVRLNLSYKSKLIKSLICQCRHFMHSTKLQHYTVDRKTVFVDEKSPYLSHPLFSMGHVKAFRQKVPISNVRPNISRDQFVLYERLFHSVTLAHMRFNRRDRYEAGLTHLSLQLQQEQWHRNSLNLSSRLKSRKASKTIKRILPQLLLSDNDEPTTIEKQLNGLMQMWEMEKAVHLLKRSIVDGIEPDRTVVLNLLQQLANLGEVECLLEVHEFLKDRKLSTNLKFYHCLCDAYFNSGRIEDGVLMLRMIYHSSRNFEDSDLFFTLLATMTAKDFNHMLPLIESYVRDLEESDPPVISARASLWRCLVLAEMFDQADALLEEFTYLKKMIPGQVTKVTQSQLEVDYNPDIVLPWIMNLPYVKPGLSATVFDMLLSHKIKKDQWSDGLNLLFTAMEEDRTIHQKTVEQFLSKFFNQLSPDHVKNLTHWATSLSEITESGS